MSQQIRNEFNNLDHKINIIEITISSELEKQHLIFLEMKKLKKKINKETKEHKRDLSLPIIVNSNISSRRGSRRGSKFDPILVSLCMNYIILASSQNKQQFDIMKDILEYSEKQTKINLERMQIDIDEYTSKVIKEMNEAIEEIKFSYNEDMKDIDGKY